MTTQKCFQATTGEIDRHWYHVDADGKVLGRLATKLATVLMGKHKPQYTPHHDVGDFVVVTNAEKIKLTGNKLDQKLYRTYSGHPGGQKTMTYRQMIERKPELLLESAVRRMLPKNKLASAMLKKLKIYAGPDHPHQAQDPKTLELQSA